MPTAGQQDAIDKFITAMRDLNEVRGLRAIHFRRVAAAAEVSPDDLRHHLGEAVKDLLGAYRDVETLIHLLTRPDEPLPEPTKVRPVLRAVSSATEEEP